MKIQSLLFGAAMMLCSTLSMADDNIDGGVTVDEKCSNSDSYVLHGKIDGHSIVHILCPSGNILVEGKIDGASRVKLEAPKGSISIGGKIDGASNVCLIAQGTVDIAEKVDNSSTKVYWQGSSGKVHEGVNGGAKFSNTPCPW